MDWVVLFCDILTSEIRDLRLEMVNCVSKLLAYEVYLTILVPPG